MDREGNAPQPSGPRPSPITQNEANNAESATVPSPPARSVPGAVGGLDAITNAIFTTPTNDGTTGNVTVGNRTGNSAAPAVQGRPTGTTDAVGGGSSAGDGDGGNGGDAEVAVVRRPFPATQPRVNKRFVNLMAMSIRTRL